MSYAVKVPRKLIEVALPLDAVNFEAAREKAIRHGHPSTLHLWWARRPLAAARAVIFAQLVNDPGYEQGRGFRYGKNKREAAVERKRLFKIIEDLVLWDNTSDEEVLERARNEIRRSWREVCELNRDHPQARKLFDPEVLPVLHDPFAGGGAIPLEAQRLGLNVFASDLNPVAVLINKAMLEIPPRFANKAPVGPSAADEGNRRLNLTASWPGVSGLAEDVRRYGAWMRQEAKRRIGLLYPLIPVTLDMIDDRVDLKPLLDEHLTVVAWIWARTVKSPSPAFSHVDVPLASSFVLSRKGHNGAYVQPIVRGDSYTFKVKAGVAPQISEGGTKAEGRGANFRCIVSEAPISGEYIKSEAQAGRMGARLMAVVVDSSKGRIYLSPTPEMEAIAQSARPAWRPTGEVPARLSGGTCVPYGLKEWGDLFTPRQLVALTTFSDLVAEARKKVACDALAAGWPEDARGLESGGIGATAYAEAISVYLAFGVDKMTDTNSTLCSWQIDPPRLRATFGRQALPMVWDFAEANVFGDAAGDFERSVRSVVEVMERLGTQRASGLAFQQDASKLDAEPPRIISTDPPYYDNIFYADLSDFFYVWLRKALRGVFPSLLATIAVPKAEELVATAHRHGSKEKAEVFFLNGMREVMTRIGVAGHPAFPVSIYYAFKQSETKAGAGTSSKGWITFLEAVHSAGLAIVGTWPMRSELATRNVGRGTNALASTIILVCRTRPADAPTTSRREFLRELNAVLPEALDEMTRGAGDERSPVAPVDLSQAIIGPGMAAFSKYSAVLEADGTHMTVQTALQLINRFLAEDDFDHDTQFCLHWFEQHGWKEGKFGDADTLARAKGTSVDGVKHGGVLFASGGIVRLLKWSEYPREWEPASDVRLPVWEALHQVIRIFRTDGESGAGKVLSAMESKAESIRQLAYRLYTLCERAGWAEDARAYNEIVTSWNSIESVAAAVPAPKQTTLF